ncbi:MAG: GAF domain-containing protein [Ardenticatenia bacterium]|nr:GAF domain-containing protein [Ardenticatenia bacterium]
MDSESRAREQLVRLQSILETLVEFEETFQFDEAWERIIRDAVHLMGATRGTLFLVDRDRNRLIPRVWYGQPWHGQGRPRGYARGEGMAGRVWITGEPINCPDVRQDPRFRRSNDPRWNEIRSLLCVPIRARERVIGVIAVDSTREHAFRDEDQQVLITLARHVATAFERAKLYQGLSDLRAIGERLNKMGPRAEYRQTLQSIVEKAVRVVAAGASSAGEAAAVIYGYDPERGAFDRSSRVAAGWREDVHVDDYPRPDGLGNRAVRQRRRVLSYEENDVKLHPAQQAQGAGAVAVYPLIAADQILGVLYITLRDERRFTRQELMLLDNFVNQAALALYHTRRIEDVNRVLARKVYELEQLRRADVLISRRPRLKEALVEILHIALEMTGAKYGSFRLYNPETGMLELAAAASVTPSPAVRQPLPLDESSVMGKAVLYRRPIRIDDVRDPAWASIYRPLLTDPPMRSELVVPLFSAGGGLEGVLNIESPQPAAFTEEDERLLVALATQAVIAIQEIKLLDTMAELTEATLTHSREELFDLIIRRACELINAPLGAIWRLVEEEGEPVLVLQAASGGHHRGDRLPVASSLTGQAILRGTPITVDDVQREPLPLRGLGPTTGVALCPHRALVGP